MAIHVVAEKSFFVREPTVVEEATPDGNFLAAFEGEIGYFYALNTAATGLQVPDSVHIYNVANVGDRLKASTREIAWSDDLRDVDTLVCPFLN